MAAFIPIGTMGLIKYISEYSSKSEFGKIAYLLKIFTLLNLPLVLLISGFLFFYSNELSLYLFSDSTYSLYFIIYALSVPMSMFASLTDTYFRGIREVKKYVIYSLFNSVLSFGFFVWLLLAYGMIGAIISISLSSIIGVAIGYFILKRSGKLVDFGKITRLNDDTIKIIIKLGLVMMLLVAIQQVVFLIIRSVLASNMGMYEVGIFQSVYGISNNYFALFLGVLGTYSIPLISTHKTIHETVLEINRTLKLLLMVYTPLVMICFSFRYILLNLFYSSEFNQAADLLFFQLLGDFTKALSWVFGLWLIPYFKTTYMMIFEIVNNLVFILLFYYLLIYQNVGIASVSIAYFSAFTVHMVLNYIFVSYGLNFKFMNNNLKSIVVSIFVVITSFLLSKYSLNWGYYTLPITLSLWIYLVISKNDYLQLKKILLQYISR